MLEFATTVGYGLSTLAFIGVAAILWRRPRWLETPLKATIFSGCWAALLLFEFYALGPASFISMNTEGDLAPPLYKYLSAYHDGGQFAFSIAGGVDLASVLGFGTQLFSLERLLFDQLPAWVAILILKVLTTALGFGGSYLVCYHGVTCTRTAALGAAALFTVSHVYLVNMSVLMGTGFAALPLILYLGVVCHGGRHFLARMFCVALLASLAQPVFVPQAIAATIVGGGVLFLQPRISNIAKGIVAPLLAVALGVLINWHEVLFAMAQVSQLTVRGVRGGGALEAAASLAVAIEQALHKMLWGKIGLVGLVLGAMYLGIKGNPFAFRAAAAPALLGILYFAVLLFPWEAAGLGAVQRISLHYYYVALNALMIPVVACAVSDFGERSDRPRFASHSIQGTAILLASATAFLVWYKVVNFSNWLYYGGQSQYTTIDNLKNVGWASDAPFRVITLRHQRPEPNLAFGFYGFDTFDGAVNLIPRPYSTFWQDGILRGDKSEGFFGRLPLFWSYFDGETYDIGRQADLDLLRLANVRYVLSPLPLKGLRLVSGPDKKSPMLADGISEFARERLDRIIHYGLIYVYELAEPLPRVYAATGVVDVGADADEKRYLEVVRNRAFDGSAVVRGYSGTGVDGSEIQLLETRFGRDSIAAKVIAPHGGNLIVNVNWYPYWSAQVDGQDVAPIPTNFVQMMIPIPPGGTDVMMRYRRPKVLDLLGISD